MRGIYYTLSKATYGLIQGKLKEEMTFEEAERLGKEYCRQYGHKYLGTFTEDTIQQEHDKVLKSIQ